MGTAAIRIPKICSVCGRPIKRCGRPVVARQQLKPALCAACQSRARAKANEAWRIEIARKEQSKPRFSSTTCFGCPMVSCVLREIAACRPESPEYSAYRSLSRPVKIL